MTTDLDICNNALMMLGEKKMTSLSEDSDKARLASGLYPFVRDRILRGHQWNAATRRVVLESPSFSPSNKSSLLTVAGRDITRDATAAAWAAVRGTQSVTSGKHYFEVTVGDMLTDCAIGVAKSGQNLGEYVGSNAYGWGYRANTGNKANAGSTSSYGSAYTAGDIIGVALDLDNGKVWFAKNGTWQASGDPAAGTNPAYSSLSGAFFPALALYDANSAADAVFLDNDLAYDPPTGFSEWPAKTPTWGYGYELALPSDWLRNVQVGDDDDDIDFKTESGALLMDARSAELRYVYRNDDPDAWDSLLLDVMHQAMAAVMAYAITQSTSKEQTEYDKLKMLLREARAVDGQDDPAQMLGDLRLYSARFR